MAPEKTEPDSSEDTPNTSTISIDTPQDGDREPYFEPVVTLPEIEVKTNEEDEIELIKLRCKLFRYDTAENPSEWKERGTGDVKILHNLEKNTLRVLMRQDRTLKIRANHYITPIMELKQSCNSDRAWVWSAISDFADEETKHETFAIRFANSDHAKLFREKFEDARGIVTVAIMRGTELQKEAIEKNKINLVIEEVEENSDTRKEIVKEKIINDSEAIKLAQEMEEKLIVSNEVPATLNEQEK